VKEVITTLPDEKEVRIAQMEPFLSILFLSLSDYLMESAV